MRIGRALADNLSDGMRALAQATAGVGMMLYLSPMLTVSALLVVPPVMLIAMVYGRRIKKLSAEVHLLVFMYTESCFVYLYSLCCGDTLSFYHLLIQVQLALANASAVADERLGSIRTVRDFTAEQRELTRFHERVEDILNVAQSEARAKAVFYGLTGFTGNLIILGVLFRG